MPYDATIPLPNAGDVVEVEELPYICRHRSFQYERSALVHIYVMVEPDEG